MGRRPSDSVRTYIGSGGGNGFTTAPDVVRFTTALQEDETRCDGTSQQSARTRGKA
ncbi:hypothetical protein EDD27_7963 [Nonomuraea polychroma]|uniref:Uncharacterized protein n=1 Tax=Nonomuraea polychroma TaxID=46176 RepID=A0A438MIC6_9ACTN|nr:hypothetical protein EDD27_7963 [Nonomuraea polychroma]